MRVVYSENEMKDAFNLARSEAMASFNDDSLYLENISKIQDT